MSHLVLMEGTRDFPLSKGAKAKKKVKKKRRKKMKRKNNSWGGIRTHNIRTRCDGCDGLGERHVHRERREGFKGWFRLGEQGGKMECMKRRWLMASKTV